VSETDRTTVTRRPQLPTGTLAPHVVAQDCPEHLIALFLVLDGRLAVFANTRLTDEPTAVAWAERTVSAGELFDVWFEGDDQPA
jgi:hypothetical protein